MSTNSTSSRTPGRRARKAGGAPDAGRVIAGSARGIRLDAAGPATRPLGDRLKQALFAMLEPGLRERRVLDLFAGTGAAGIEALSRGARGAIFVESDGRAVQAIRSNLERCHLGGPAVSIEATGVVPWLDRDASGSAVAGTFGLVLVDPPYERVDLLTATLGRLGTPDAADYLDPGAIVVAKSFWRDAPPASVGLLASEGTRRFGETVLTIYRRLPRPAMEA